MKRIKTLVADNILHYPEFEEAFKLLDIADSDLACSDVKLDCSKSLLEWCSKNINFQLDKSTDERQLKKQQPKKAFESAVRNLAKHDDTFEVAVLTSFSGIISSVLELRNDRGEISHGHTAPKPRSSNEFGEFVLAISVEVCFYMLKSFYSVDPLKVSYEANEDFNDLLDDENEGIGRTLYSQLLFENDLDAYNDRLDHFNAEREELAASEAVFEGYEA